MELIDNKIFNSIFTNFVLYYLQSNDSCEIGENR